MNNKLWSGRFTKQSNILADEFNSSISFDAILYGYDIRGSIAHCKMLAACNIISDEDSDCIVGSLYEIKDDIDSGVFMPSNAEDVHMLIESELIKRIGDTGKKLHTARSRNDQVATDFRMYTRDAAVEIISSLCELIEVIGKISKENVSTILPGYTHLQKAQPITFAHHLNAYCEMLLRDAERFKDSLKRINILPLGSCALAGTTYQIDRQMVASLLNFDGISNNSMDAVSDRDFALEFLFNCSTVSMHLSRLAEELVLWSTEEFNFIVIDDAFATGSSIMPNKKNPDMAELVRGKCGRIYGNLFSLMTVLKGLPLAYNKDMQEDKEPLFDSHNTIVTCLKILTAMLPSITINTTNMRRAAGGGFTSATDVADYLVKKGMPFREAHEVSGNIVLYCIQNTTKINKLSVTQFNQFSVLFDKDILEAVKLNNMVNNRTTLGGPAKSETLRQLKSIKKKTDKLKIYKPY